MIRYCSLTTLPAAAKNWIKQYMMWADGGMENFIKYKVPNTKVALNYKGARIVCWATLSFNHYEGDDCPEVGVWTLEGERGKGHSVETIKALCEKVKYSPTAPIYVYERVLIKILKQAGYTPKYRRYDHRHFYTWLEENFT